MARVRARVRFTCMVPRTTSRSELSAAKETDTVMPATPSPISHTIKAIENVSSRSVTLGGGAWVPSCEAGLARYVTRKFSGVAPT